MTIQYDPVKNLLGYAILRATTAMSHSHNTPQKSYHTYSALSVAKYIIDNSPYEVSNLKLQKMLYFIQGFAFAKLGQALFPDEIEAWTYGPVVPNVYREYMQYGALPLRGFSVPAEQIEDPDIKAFLDSLIESMSSYSASQLVKMTHVPASPWYETWMDGSGRFSRIPKERISAYFKKKLP